MSTRFHGSQSKKELSLSNTAMTGLIRDVLEKQQSLRFEAKGHSMAPFIKHLDIVTISPLGAGLPKKGDIVAFTRPDTGKLIVHRVVSANTHTSLVKGDNTAETDGEIPFGNILGIVTKIERGEKNIRLGLGPEKRIISLLSRTGLLKKLKWSLRKLLNLRKTAV